LKNETVFLLVLVSPGQPQGYSLCISEGIQAFTLLVIFQIYHDKMFTKINNFLYIILNIFMMMIYNYDQK